MNQWVTQNLETYQSDRKNDTMKIDRIDHLALTVYDSNKTVASYSKVLGMSPEIFGDGRVAVTFGPKNQSASC
jgi:hypothetical protein